MYRKLLDFRRQIGQGGLHGSGGIVRDHVTATGHKLLGQRDWIRYETVHHLVQTRKTALCAKVSGVADHRDMVARHPLANRKSPPPWRLPRGDIGDEQLGSGEMAPGVARQRMPEVEIVKVIQISREISHCQPIICA